MKRVAFLMLVAGLTLCLVVSDNFAQRGGRGGGGGGGGRGGGGGGGGARPGGFNGPGGPDLQLRRPGLQLRRPGPQRLRRPGPQRLLRRREGIPASDPAAAPGTLAPAAGATQPRAAAPLITKAVRSAVPPAAV